MPLVKPLMAKELTRLASYTATIFLCFGNTKQVPVVVHVKGIIVL